MYQVISSSLHAVNAGTLKSSPLLCVSLAQFEASIIEFHFNDFIDLLNVKSFNPETVPPISPRKYQINTA